MAKLKSLTDLRFYPPFSPFNSLCSGLRRFHVAPLALLLAVGVGWSAPAASAQAVNFGSVNVCPSGATTPAPCNKTLAVSFTVPASGTLGTPEVFTQGAPNLDFTLASGSTCVGTVTKGASCVVNVTFTPLAPGQRKGGVQLVDGSGNVLANAYIYGTGVGPAIAFSPSAQTTLSSDFESPYGVAVDASSNLYITDFTYNGVYEILAVNGSIPANPTVRGVATIGSPYGVAVDGSGNLFVATTGIYCPYPSGYPVYEILAVNGSIPANPTINTLGGFHTPHGVAVDGSGNVFIADDGGCGSNAASPVDEILAVNGGIPANPTINTLASGFFTLNTAAVDGSGNVFVDDYVTVREILAVNGSIPANPTINTLFNADGGDTDGMAVDGTGNVFIADDADNTVYEILAVNGSIPANPTTTNLISSFHSPGALAVDGRGDVFVVSYNGGYRVIEIQRSQPPALTFAYTPVGTTSGDSPQSVIFQNIGNAPLTGSGVLSDTVDFVTVAGPGIVPDCTYDLSLVPGAECNISFDFTPQSAGPLNATLTLSDNALNGNPATQSISLSGIGVNPNGPPLALLSATALHFGTIAFGTTEALSLTTTNIGGGTLTVSPSIGGPSYTISGSTCTGGVTAGNSCTLQVQFSPVTIGSHVDILTLQTNGAANPTVTLHGKASGVGVETEGPLQFGTIAFGTTKVLPLTITNIGVSGTVTFGTSIGGPSYKVLTNAQNTCLSGVTAGQSCTLPIEFDPVSVGMHDDILTLTPSGGAAPSTPHLDGFAN